MVMKTWAHDQAPMSVDAGLVGVGASGVVEFPECRDLIEHQLGLVLFDTGLEPAAEADPRLVCGDPADSSTHHFAPGSVFFSSSLEETRGICWNGVREARGVFADETTTHLRMP